MKRLCLLILLSATVICCGKKDNSNPPTPEPPAPTTTEHDSGVTPGELAQTVSQILAELKPDLSENDLPFSKAELTVSAKEAKGVGVQAKADLFVKLEGEVAREDETSVEVSYELKPQVQGTIQIKRLQISDIDFAPNKFNKNSFMHDKIPNAQKLHKKLDDLPVGEVRRATQQAVDSVKKNQELVQERYINEQLKNAFVNSILNSIEEYKKMKGDFGDACINVTISFTITKKASATAGFEIKGSGVSGSLSRSTEGTHTLKLSFGKC